MTFDRGLASDLSEQRQICRPGTGSAPRAAWSRLVGLPLACGVALLVHRKLTSR
jgi:hypothetical protein